MKKGMKTFLTLLFLVLAVSGASATEKRDKSGIKTVDNYIAVFDFEVRDKDKDISRPLADKVIHEFSQSDKYEVIDRGNMNKILGEQKFQMSGCVAQECKVEAGQILGVGKIISGSVGIVGKTYYLTLQLIDVKTGKVELSAEDICKCEVDELLDSTRRLAKKLLGEKVEDIADKRRPEKAVLFEERFVSNEKGWFIVNDSEKRFEITNGKYVLESKKGGTWISTRNVPFDQGSDFRIDMAAEKMSGTDDYGYGLVWGMRDLKTYYLFAVAGNGYFICESAENGSVKRILGKQEKAVHRSNMKNSLSLRKSGATLEFYINDAFVAKTPFMPFFGDWLGCAVYSGNKAITIGFDDIIVRQY